MSQWQRKNIPSGLMMGRTMGKGCSTLGGQRDPLWKGIFKLRPKGSEEVRHEDLEVVGERNVSEYKRDGWHTIDASKSMQTHKRIPLEPLQTWLTLMSDKSCITLVLACSLGWCGLTHPDQGLQNVDYHLDLPFNYSALSPATRRRHRSSSVYLLDWWEALRW